MKKHTRMVCTALSLLLICSVFSAFTAAHGAQRRTVKLGYAEQPGYIEKRDNGEYIGCGVKLLSEVAGYAGWNIEYVSMPWSEQLDALERGDIDFVAMAQHTPERAEKYLYSRQPVGIIQGFLMTLPEEQNGIKNNVLAYDGKKIGILRGSRNIDFLDEHAERMGFSFNRVEYDSQSELEEGLISGEVDIIASEQAVSIEGLRVLDRFAADPYYFLMAKSSTELMSELNYAVSRIYLADPTYPVRLNQEYYGDILAGSSPYFTKEEMQFIETHKDIKIALIPGNQPLAYENENGETEGLLPDIIKQISALCGINFSIEFIPTDTTPIAFLQQNPSYLASGMLASNPAFEDDGILVSEVYYTTYAALAAHERSTPQEDYKTGAYKTGTNQSFQAMQLFIKKNYPNMKVEMYPTVEDGLKGLEKGEIDFFAYNASPIISYLSNPLFGDISIVDDQFMPCPLCTIAINTPESALLLGIFEKCMSIIPDEEFAKLEGTYIQRSVYRFSDQDAFQRYQKPILYLVSSIALIISALLLLLLLRQRKFNRDITLHAEYDIMTGLYNRNTAKAKVVKVLEQSKGMQCALLVLDVDDMKNINDAHGQHVGDEVLKAIANILRTQFGGTTLMCRAGGDNFAVFLRGVESQSMLVAMITKLQRTISATAVAGTNLALNVSIGVSVEKAGDCDANEMYRRAEEAKNVVKQNGKNGFSFYSSRKTMSYIAIQKRANGEYSVENASNSATPELYDATVEPEELFAAIDSDFQRIIESSPNIALYVITEKTRKVLYYNRHFREICPTVKIGAGCRDLMVGPCQNCLVDTMGEKKMAHTIFYSDSFGDEVEITATKILWKDKIPAVMITLWPRNLLTSSHDNLPSASNQNIFDYVTGGLTRQGFIHMVERMQVGGINLADYAILFINIQDFKAVNELTGSDGGDNLLRSVFARIEQSSLHPIIGARKESDHFVFLVEKSALDLSELSSLLNFHWQYSEKDLFILARCGIFMIEDGGLEVYKMMDRAKLAKSHIVDEYVQPYAVYDPSMLKEYSEKAEAFQLFDHGISNKEFIVYYQPVVDAKTEKVIGAEALVRRRMPDGVIVSPGRFIPILERTGYITLLDRFVGNEVRRFQIQRMEAGLPIVPISFNLSQKDFYDAAIMELLVKGFEENAFPRGAVLLEVTESAYTLNEKKQGDLLKRLREAGAQILLDDFGTGYSSFGMFENYYFDRVKLDMSFVRQLEKNERVRLVVESIISMCHKLGIHVVAEGVETETELKILREMDCDYIQGYYFSKPLDEQSFVKYLENSI